MSRYYWYLWMQFIRNIKINWYEPKDILEKRESKLKVCRPKTKKGMCIKKSSCCHIGFVARRKRKREKSNYYIQFLIYLY